MIEARGRNGFFKADSWGAIPLAKTRGEKLPQVYVWIQSARGGKSDPISLTGPKNEVRALLQNLIDNIDGKSSPFKTS